MTLFFFPSRCFFFPSQAYTLLLNQLHPAGCDLSPLRQTEPQQRAAVMLQQANKLGVAKCAPRSRPSLLPLICT